MKKNELAQELSEQSSLTYKQSKEAVDTLIEIVTQNLIDGENIEIASFGKLEVKERAAHQGVNPVTKEKIQIEASRNVSFKTARALKEKLNH